MLFKKKSGGEVKNSAPIPVITPKAIASSALFRKYFISIFGIIFAVISISGLLMMAIVTKEYEKQTLGDLEGSAENIAGLSGSLLGIAGAGDYIADYENALSLICFTVKDFSENSGDDIFVVNSSGKVIICKELLSLNCGYMQDGVCTLHKDIAVPQERLDAIKAGKNTSYIGSVDDSGKNKMSIAAKPIYISDKEDALIGYVFVVRDSSDHIRNAVSSIRIQFIISVAVSLALAIVVLYTIVFRLAAPLQEILYATRMYAKGDFSYRIRERIGNDEMYELTKAFNSMANDLSAIENSRRNFVANVSHELKTPMTTIGGFIDGILDGTIPPSQHKKYMGIVSDEVRRLSRLITSMLNMSKIEAGELTPSYTKFSLADMLVRTFLSFEQIISQRGINVTGLDAMESISVSADPDMINQVIYNIIDNAVKFTPDGGEIAVSCLKRQEKAVVKVRNYGIGIANEELKMVFDRFYKVDKSRSLNTKSVGLGLYICKNIVELHNGRIYATSENDQYTEFTVELPIRQH